MKLHFWPDEALKTPAVPVDLGSLEDWGTILRDASSLMRARAGVGLAANQVGDPRSWFIFTDNDERDKLVANPVLVRKPEAGTTTTTEGCLSFPNVFVQKPRLYRVELHAQQWIGGVWRPYVEEATGTLARVFQHECDHLNGKNCILSR